MATKYQVRSVSLPSKSHPSILKIHEELNRLRSLQNLSPCTLEIVCSNLAGLAELYVCVDGFLNMESTREAFSHCKEEIWVSEVLDGSVQMLGVCSSLRDGMAEVKEHVQDLQFSLRRRKGDSSIEKSICRYVNLRKKMNKDSKNMIQSLNRMVHRQEAPASQKCLNSCFSMVQILIQVNIATVQVYKSLLSFLPTPVSTTKMTKWSLITKMRKKKVAAVAWEDASVNEFANVDSVLFSSSLASHKSEGSCNKAAPLISTDKLVLLELSVETIEIHMGIIFRNMVMSRVSLLNTFSQ